MIGSVEIACEVQPASAGKTPPPQTRMGHVGQPVVYLVRPVLPQNDYYQLLTAATWVAALASSR